MGDPRIIDIELDDRTILWRSADVEQERRIAIYDLLEENRFRPVVELERPCDGQFKLLLRVEEGRLIMDLSDGESARVGSISFALAPFRRTSREYFAICDSYYKAIRNATPQQYEKTEERKREGE